MTADDASGCAKVVSITLASPTGRLDCAATASRLRDRHALRLADDLICALALGMAIQCFTRNSFDTTLDDHACFCNGDHDFGVGVALPAQADTC